MHAVGLCLGASRVSFAVIEAGQDSIRLLSTGALFHNADVKGTVKKLCATHRFDTIDRLAVTGRKFRRLAAVPSLSEPEAVETAFAYLQRQGKYPGCDTIVAAGGENFLAYRLDPSGRIIKVVTGNKCASGTGEFFLQQIRRMDLSPQEAFRIADLDNPYNVASRCSVFCKSDCTHALNKGEPKSRVAAGLCRMMARKIAELVDKCNSTNILLTGGSARNEGMVSFLRREFGNAKSLSIADEAEYFEALGAALWALDNGAPPAFTGSIFIPAGVSSFAFFPPLAAAAPKVTFKSMERGVAAPGDECIVGLDVGSTTTKAIVMRMSDNSLLASVYLRTAGDPLRASAECYRSLAAQLPDKIVISGLGVTGSGRQIAGLHAETDGVINEIIAHATAAVHFDPGVDTIFEIGGQDAKYTFIANGVPADYAMNEACSAGTGSFLEESARETMGIPTEEIAEAALRSTRPPNFSDQCAAFISSDIKNAIQEGLSADDIAAGLVYSICQNYANRVKGCRPVGRKVFMQGGVCYNRAVPMAMAAITGKDIIVPPEPGLMGAYGVALAVKQKIALGLLAKSRFDLKELAGRKVTYGKPFVCGGGAEACDRKCVINIIELDGRPYPFGGACNRYVNLRRSVRVETEKLDHIAKREKAFLAPPAGPYAVKSGQGQFSRGKIGLTKSLLTNSLYPLYDEFFRWLGYETVLADAVLPEGTERQGAAFCYPVEQAHGMMADLLQREADWLFLPHVMGIPSGAGCSVTCPFVQGEPYYLKTAFPELANRRVLSPMLDLSEGFDGAAKDFVALGRDLGATKAAAAAAYRHAVTRQLQYLDNLRAAGRKVLADLAANPGRMAVVLFGRPYNAFSRTCNMGIPGKFSSRGVMIIPWEYLPLDGETPIHHMFWATGQLLLRTAKFVKKHPQLFAAYITNFSCGPDSFIVSYFRDIMGQKPSLVLELDSHTADAGIDTRIEAFLDVVNSYRETRTEEPAKVPAARAAFVDFAGGQPVIVDSRGRRHSLSDEKVRLVVPSMGAISTPLFAASLRYAGYRASPLAPANERDFIAGRANSSCKECLPYILVAGSVLNDATSRRAAGDDGLLAYFFADSSGPCRFGQYQVSIKRLIEQHGLEDTAVFTLSSDNSYAGLNARARARAWQAIVIGDVLADIYSSLLVLAKDKEEAQAIFAAAVREIERAIETASWSGLKAVLDEQAGRLAKIPRLGHPGEVPKVALLGEIFVRADGFSRQNLVERLAKNGIITRVAPIIEFIYFCDYLLQRSLYHVKSSRSERFLSLLYGYYKRHAENSIKTILSRSGLCSDHLVDVPRLTKGVSHIISPRFTAGETTLTIAAALADVIERVAGIISIGPFGCMPNRVAEAILSDKLSAEKPMVAANRALVEAVLKQHPSLPFLSIESDGNPFPPLIEAKLEVFCLQVSRIHRTISRLTAGNP